MSRFVCRKELFFIPENVIYLDGNSLGPMPKPALAAMNDVMTHEWGEMLITAWNKAAWIDLPQKLGDLIAPIIGASAGSVTTGDTLSIKMMQALDAGLKLRPERKVVLSDNGNFPTDLYMAQGLLDALGGYELRIVDPEAVYDALDESVAAMMITHVDYRTGRMHDMKALTERAHEVGAIALWDLAHSAGAMPLEVEELQLDMAAGCSYKYLNGGPGAPAFIYVHPRLVNEVQPILSGWMGHEAPFAFDLDYRPRDGIERMRVGTPPILQMRVLETALQIFQDVDMGALREKSLHLTELFMGEIGDIAGFEIVTPLEARARGSQVSITHEHSYALMQALIDHGVIGDFRAPNIMRFGFTPLYIDEADVLVAVERLRKILSSKIYLDEKYQKRAKVT